MINKMIRKYPKIKQAFGFKVSKLTFEHGERVHYDDRDFYSEDPAESYRNVTDYLGENLLETGINIRVDAVVKPLGMDSGYGIIDQTSFYRFFNSMIDRWYCRKNGDASMKDIFESFKSEAELNAEL